MKKCSTGTNCYIGNKKVHGKKEFVQLDLILPFGMKKMFHSNCYIGIKKVPLEQKLKFIQLDTILPLKFKKNVSLEQIIPLEPMEKNVPSQLPGGKKKELAKLGLNHQWPEQKNKN